MDAQALSLESKFMSESDQPSEKSCVADVESLLKPLSKNLTKLKTARANLDLKTSSKSLDDFDIDIRKFVDSWDKYKNFIQSKVQDELKFIKSEDYPLKIEEALKSAGVPVRGEFPNYDFPPFNLKIDVENSTVVLKMGRKVMGEDFQRILEPSKIAEWVSKQYKKVVNTKFNSDQFCKELFTIYETANRLSSTKSEVQWGHPVPLKEIYKLLTIKSSVRNDYPESLFTYDLTRLKEQFEISYEGHRFELIPSRNSSSGLLLITSSGQEIHVSDLIIYNK